MLSPERVVLQHDSTDGGVYKLERSPIAVELGTPFSIKPDFPRLEEATRERWASSYLSTVDQVQVEFTLKGVGSGRVSLDKACELIGLHNHFPVGIVHPLMVSVELDDIPQQDLDRYGCELRFGDLIFSGEYVFDKIEVAKFGTSPVFFTQFVRQGDDEEKKGNIILTQREEDFRGMKITIYENMDKHKPEDLARELGYKGPTAVLDMQQDMLNALSDEEVARIMDLD